MQLVVADEQDKPIQNVFPEVFEFLKTVTEPTGEEVEVAEVNPAEMAYPNSTSTVLINY